MIGRLQAPGTPQDQRVLGKCSPSEKVSEDQVPSLPEDSSVQKQEHRGVDGV